MLRSAGCCARPVSPRVRQFDVKGIPSLNATYLYIGFCTRFAIVIFAVPLRSRTTPPSTTVPAVSAEPDSGALAVLTAVGAFPFTSPVVCSCCPPLASFARRSGPLSVFSLRYWVQQSRPRIHYN